MARIADESQFELVYSDDKVEYLHSYFLHSKVMFLFWLYDYHFTVFFVSYSTLIIILFPISIP